MVRIRPNLIVTKSLNATELQVMHGSKIRKTGLRPLLGGK